MSKTFPKCVNNHAMIPSTFSGMTRDGGYSDGHFCDLCTTKGSSTDARWYCSECGIDCCFQCRPVEDSVEDYKEKKEQFLALQYASDRFKRSNKNFISRILAEGDLPLVTSNTMLEDLASRWGISTDELIDFQTKFTGLTSVSIMGMSEEAFNASEDGLGCNCVIACSEKYAFEGYRTLVGTYPSNAGFEGYRQNLIDQDPLKLTGPFKVAVPGFGTDYGTAYWEGTSVGWGVGSRGAASFLMEDSREYKPRLRRNRSISIMPCNAMDGEAVSSNWENASYFSGNWTQKELEARMLAIFRVMWLTSIPDLNEALHERLELLMANKQNKKNKKRRNTKTKGSKISKKSKTVANKDNSDDDSKAHSSSSSSSSSTVKIKQEIEVEVNIPGIVDPFNIAMGTKFHYKFSGYGVWQGFVIGYDNSTMKYSVVFKKEGEEDDLKTYTSKHLASMMKRKLLPPTETLNVKVEVEVEVAVPVSVREE